jgi:hypothetical protein
VFNENADRGAGFIVANGIAGTTLGGTSSPPLKFM